jgi:hypothetical protein
VGGLRAPGQPRRLELRDLRRRHDGRPPAGGPRAWHT